MLSRALCCCIWQPPVEASLFLRLIRFENEERAFCWATGSHAAGVDSHIIRVGTVFGANPQATAGSCRACGGTSRSIMGVVRWALHPHHPRNTSWYVYRNGYSDVRQSESQHGFDGSRQVAGKL